MMHTSKKPPHGRYACAEDLCDAFEDTYDRELGDRPDSVEAEYTLPKPRTSRAVRLVDALHDTEPMTSHRPPNRARTAGDGEGSPRNRSVREIHAAFPATPCAPPLPELPEDAYTVLSVYPEGEGETVAVILSIPREALPAEIAEKQAQRDGRTGNSPRDKVEKVKLHLLVEQYAERPIRTGRISPTVAEELLEAGRLCAAVQRGVRLLSFGDQSAKRLVYKLTAKGIERSVAESAVRYLTEKGYIHEDDTARLRVAADLRKLWGPRRIREDLRASGFTPEAIDDAMEATDDVDFEANCIAVIRKKYAEVPTDRNGQQKLIAALMRLGYDADTVRIAIRRILRES